TIQKTRGGDGAVIAHVERVSQTGYAGKFCRGDAHSVARPLLDQFRGSISLAAVHAGAGNQHERSGLAQRLPRFESTVADVSNGSVFIARKADDFEFDGIAQTGVMTGAVTDNAAHIQQMKLIAGREICGHIADKTL